MLSEQKRTEAEDECRLLEESVERSISIRMENLNHKLQQQQTLRTLGLFSNSEVPSGDQEQLAEDLGFGLEEFLSSQAEDLGFGLEEFLSSQLG